MLGLPLSLWLTFTPAYFSTMGTGSGIDADLSYKATNRASIVFNVGSLSASDFKDRHGSLDLEYDLIEDRLAVVTGAGFDQYDLYGAGPTVDKDLHCKIKVKVF